MFLATTETEELKILEMVSSVQLGGSRHAQSARSCSVGLSHAQLGSVGLSRAQSAPQAWFLSPQSCLPSLDGAIALSSHSRLVEVTELKEFRERLSEPWTELGRRSSKSSRY